MVKTLLDWASVISLLCSLLIGVLVACLNPLAYLQVQLFEGTIANVCAK